MPFGFSIGQLVGLAREARDLEQASRSIVVAGPGAQELARALAEGGDPRALAVNGDATTAAATVRLLDGPPSESELAALRRGARAGVPQIVVRRDGGTTTVPYVLPQDVIDARAGEVPVQQVARALAAALPPEDGAAVAARLPRVRAPIQRRIIHRTALANAGIGAAPWIKQAHMPLMTLAQGRMLLELQVAAGDAARSEPQPLARAAGPALAGSLGAGFGLRSLYRRLPIRGSLAAGAFAYAATRALGELRARL